jgi:lipoate synthase
MAEHNGQPAPPTLQEMVGKCQKKTYLVEILVLDKAVRAPLSAISLESISHMASIFVAMNWPNVYGYNIFNETGTEILEMVNVVAFTNHFMKTIQQIAGAQVLKSAVPVIGAGEQGENLVKLMEEARKAGRLMPGSPAPAPPTAPSPAPTEAAPPNPQG